MRFKSVSGITYSLIVFLLMLSCDNIIQKATSDYFPFTEGNWWRYVSNNDTILVEVEPADTILQRECVPISYGGAATYLAKDDEAISEYVKIIYNFSGLDYTIIENFIRRIELPLINGNSYRDSLIDSLNISGQWISAKYQINSVVSDTDYIDTLYSGDVYKIAITISQNLISPDTSIIDSTYVEEYYAPNIGLIRFVNTEGDYSLMEYEVR